LRVDPIVALRADWKAVAVWRA